MMGEESSGGIFRKYAWMLPWDVKPEPKETRTQKAARFASPFLILFAALTILGHLAAFVVLHDVFETLLLKWREILRNIWSYAYRLIHEWVAISIDERFSELLSFAVFAFAVGLRGKSTTLRLFENRQHNLSYRVIAVSWLLWLAAGSSFFAQLFDYGSHGVLATFRQVVFQSCFMFAPILVFYSLLPKQLHFDRSSPRLDLKLRAASIFMAMGFATATVAFSAVPSQLAALLPDFERRNEIASALPPDYASIPVVSRSLNCSPNLRPDNLVGLSTEASLRDSKQFAKIDALLKETRNEAIIAQLRLEGAQEIAKIWNEIAEDPLPYAEALAAEEYASRDYFSYDYLSLLAGTVSPKEVFGADTDFDLSSARRDFSEHFSLNDLRAWITSFEPAAISAENMDGRSPQWAFKFREGLCYYNGIGDAISCLYYPVQFSIEKKSLCAELKTQLDETCFTSKTGGEVLIALSKANQFPGSFDIASLFESSIWQMVEYQNRLALDSHDLAALRPSEFYGVSSLDAIDPVALGFSDHPGLEPLLEKKDTESMNILNSRDGNFRFYPNPFNWDEAVKFHSAQLSKIAPILSNQAHLAPYEQNVNSALGKLESAEKEMKSFLQPFSVPIEVFREQRKALDEADYFFQKNNFSEKRSKLHVPLCETLNTKTKTFREELGAIIVSDWRAVENAHHLAEPYTKGLPSDRIDALIKSTELEITFIGETISLLTTEFQIDPEGSAKKVSSLKEYIALLESEQKWFEMKSSLVEAENQIRDETRKASVYNSRQYLLHNMTVICFSLVVLTAAIWRSFITGMLPLARVLWVALILLISALLGGIILDFAEALGVYEPTIEPLSSVSS